jgi:hypothetical protein
LRDLGPIRGSRLQLYRCPEHRPMLRVVDDALNSSKDGCVEQRADQYEDGYA